MYPNGSLTDIGGSPYQLDKFVGDTFHRAHNMSEKCLVTGAAGFIGSHLVDALLARGDSVVGVDNMKLGRRENLNSALGNLRFTFYEADVNDVPRLNEIVAKESASSKFTCAWHLAANSDIRAGVTDSDVDLRDTFLTEEEVPLLHETAEVPLRRVPGLKFADLRQQLVFERGGGRGHRVNSHASGRCREGATSNAITRMRAVIARDS